MVAAVRSANLAEPEVVRMLDELTKSGEVVLRSYPVQDPHLAFDRLDFVAPVSEERSETSVRDAELAAEHAYNEWLADWLRSHRCS